MTINKLTADALVDGTLDSDAIGPASITTAKLHSNIISGQTAIGAIDTSNDLLLIYDNDTTSLKKVPVASVGATNTDSITEGSSNLYYTDARADARITNAIKDEDNMASNSATHVPSQQSVKAYVDTEVAGIVASAPGTLDTLNELASALGDDANFSTTVTNSIATKLPIAGGTMTGALNVSNDVYFSGQLGLGSSNATSPECQIFIAGNSTTTISDSDSLFGTNRNSFIKLENESSTSGVETGIILRAKQAGAGVWAIYAKHTGNYTGDLIFRGRNAQNTNAEVLRLTAGGNVGIGTNSPQSFLHVQTSGSDFLRLTSATGNNDTGIDFFKTTTRTWNIRNNGNDDFLYITPASINDADAVLSINPNGNVGIGTTNPESNLEVSNGSERYRIAFGTGEVYLMARNASAYIEAEYIAEQHEFRGYGNDSGNLAWKINSSGHLIPGANDARNIGESGTAVSNMYMAGGIHFTNGGHGNAHAVHSGGSNYLDAYERGTFTFTLIGDSNPVTTNIAAANTTLYGTGYYEKIGNLCYVSCAYDVTNYNNYVFYHFGNIPFTSYNNSNMYYDMSCGHLRGILFRYSSSTGTNFTFNASVPGNSTQIDLRTTDTTTPFSGYFGVHNINGGKYIRASGVYATA